MSIIIAAFLLDHHMFPLLLRSSHLLSISALCFDHQNTSLLLLQDIPFMLRLGMIFSTYYDKTCRKPACLSLNIYKSISLYIYIKSEHMIGR